MDKDKIAEKINKLDAETIAEKKKELKEYKPRMTVTVDPEVYELSNLYVKKTGISRSQLVNKLLKDFFISI